MITLELAALGSLAGFTIFLGLPVAVMRGVSARVKGFLNAITIGVLIFILIEVLPTAKQYTENAVTQSGFSVGSEYVAALVLGLVIGMFGLVAYERQFIRIRQKRMSLANGKSPPDGKSLGLGEAAAQGASTVTAQKSLLPKEFSAEEARHIALSIAVGIGVHNFTEGLAIGQSYTSALVSFSYLLVIGFAIHNTTEGFGIAAPMAGIRPTASYLVTLGFIGGAPTLLGALVGGVFSPNPILLTFILAAAAGALIYVISGMFYVARRQTSNELFMLGILLGFLIAYGTDLWLATMGM